MRNIIRPSKRALLTETLKNSLPFHYLIQFLLISVAVAIAGGVRFPEQLLPFSATSDEIYNLYGSMDAGSYLLGGKKLAEVGSAFVPGWGWILNLWPPGMVWLHALIIRFGLSAPVVFATLVVCTWALPMALISKLLASQVRNLVFIILGELCLFSIPTFQDWIFGPGLLFSDGIAGGAFFAALSILSYRYIVSGPTATWVASGIFAGIFIAIAGYFRSSYILTAFFILTFFIVGVIATVIRRKQSRFKKGLSFKLLALTGLVGVVPLLLFAPYSLLMSSVNHRISFVIVEELAYEHFWLDRDLDHVPGFIADAGGTIGCDIDPAQCHEVHSERAAGVIPTQDELRSRAFNAIVNHPVSFIMNRITYFSRQWFQTEYFYNPNGIVLVQGLFWGLAAVTTLIYSVMAFRRARWETGLIFVILISALAPLGLAHFEPRYFLPIRIYALLLPFMFILSKGQDSRSS